MVWIETAKLFGVKELLKLCEFRGIVVFDLHVPYGASVLGKVLKPLEAFIPIGDPGFPRSVGLGTPR